MWLNSNHNGVNIQKKSKNKGRKKEKNASPQPNLAWGLATITLRRTSPASFPRFSILSHARTSTAARRALLLTREESDALLPALIAKVLIGLLSLQNCQGKRWYPWCISTLATGDWSCQVQHASWISYVSLKKSDHRLKRKERRKMHKQ